MRLNDVVFGAHAVVLSSITWSMFSQQIWGYEQGRAKIGRSVMGIMLGCITAVLCVVAVVEVKGRDGGNDPSTWAWIDVVGIKGRLMMQLQAKELTNWAYL